MVIDELIVRNGTTNMPIDSYDNQMIDEIVYEGQKFHFAKQKDLTGETEIFADNSVQEPIRELSTEGNTFQQTYEGRNKFNVEAWEELIKTTMRPNGTEPVAKGVFVEYEGRRCFKLTNCGYSTLWFYLPENIHGFRLTKLTNGGTYQASFAQVRYTDGTVSYLGSGTVAQRDTWLNMSYYNANKIIERFGIFFSPTDETIIYIDLDSIMAEESSKATDYEPYVGGIPSPNPNYPQEIVNAENLSVQLSGVNLFDILQPKFSGNADIVSKTDNSITIKQTSTGQYQSYNIALPIDGKDLLGKKVTIKAKCTQTDNLPRGGIRLQFVQSSGLTVGTMYAFTNMPTGATEKELKATGTISDLPDLEANPTAKLCLMLYSNANGTGSTTTEITYSDIMVSLEDIPYEPYIEPQTVEIPKEIDIDGTIVPLNFAKVDDVADTLIVNTISKKVTYVQKIWGVTLTPSLGIVSWYSTTKADGTKANGVSIWNKKYFPQTGFYQKGYCTHAQVHETNTRVNVPVVVVGVNSYAIYFFELMDFVGATSNWVDRENPTTEEKNAGRQACVDWFAENKPYLEYVLPTPIEYDLTNTDLGQRLLTLEMPNGTGVLKITSDTLPVSKTELSYWRQIIPNE